MGLYEFMGIFMKGIRCNIVKITNCNLSAKSIIGIITSPTKKKDSIR